MRESVFGIPIKYDTWNKSSMPLYIAGSMNFVQHILLINVVL